MKGLRILDPGSNSITSSFSKTMVNMWMLKRMNIEKNDIEGTIPIEFELSKDMGRSKSKEKQAEWNTSY